MIDWTLPRLSTRPSRLADEVTCTDEVEEWLSVSVSVCE